MVIIQDHTTEIIAKPIFELRKNRIFDDGKYYILEHIPTKEKAYFDRTDKALKAVKRGIEDHGTIGYNKAWNQFWFGSMKKQPIYLSQLLYKVYSGKPLPWVRKGLVRFADGNTHNFTRGNLVHTRTNTADNRNRWIYQIGEYTFLFHKKSGRTFFCKNDPELFDLLCHNRITWTPNTRTGSLQANIVRRGKKISDFMPYFHQFIYAFEYYGARRNNYISRIRKMQAEFDKKGLTIDHLDNNHENGMPWNLSTMTKPQNSAKNDMLGRVRYPFFLFAVYYDNKYRIYCGRIYGTIASAMDMGLYICETPDALIDFMTYFLNLEWEDGLTAARNLKENPDAVCFQNYFGDFGASKIRDELMTKPESEFTVWRKAESESIEVD